MMLTIIISICFYILIGFIAFQDDHKNENELFKFKIWTPKVIFQRLLCLPYMIMAAVAIVVLFVPAVIYFIISEKLEALNE